MTMQRNKTIWIDLDNSPHVPFFKPIIEELNRRGYETFITARDCFQTCELADQYGYRYMKIGRHYGKNKLAKMFGLSYRALQLIFAVGRQKPVLALSHGSRSQTIAASLLGIKSTVILDYEHAKFLPFFPPDWVITPAIIPPESIPLEKSRILTYQGLKEDVYIKDFEADPSILDELGLSGNDIVVTVRPPANEAHYHNPESEVLFHSTVNMLGENDDIRLVVLPRNEKQGSIIKKTWPQLVKSKKLIIPERVVNGLNLLWHSDFAISGGGTMNREAAALSVPVYSIFRGKIGAVDRYLAERGSLIMIETVKDVRSLIQPLKRIKEEKGSLNSGVALKQIVSAIEEVIDGSSVS